MTRRATFVALAVVALIAVGVLAAYLLLRDGDDEAAYATMSAQEQPFEMPVPVSLGLPSSPKTTGEAFFVAERDGTRIVRVPREDGSSCWGTSERRSNEWQLTSFICESQFGRFPDAESPVMLLARGGFLAGTDLMVYESFIGLAADGVAKVGVIDEQDRLVPMADVDGNAFYADAPDGRVRSVVALDEAGEVIWKSPPRTPPDE
ncbi:MAG TPA: hypothetical protein VHI12_00255 [Gaiellaceae bacterium]|nr:hypothetical protein [Gaiellaceae bacterium]